MNIIQQNLQKYMENPHAKLTSSGVFTVQDFNNLSKVLNNTEEDFLIFDNAGGRKFDIVFDQGTFPVKNLINSLLEEHKSWIYCYQLNKKQVILRPIV